MWPPPLYSVGLWPYFQKKSSWQLFKIWRLKNRCKKDFHEILKNGLLKGHLLPNIDLFKNFCLVSPCFYFQSYCFCKADEPVSWEPWTKIRNLTVPKSIFIFQVNECSKWSHFVQVDSCLKGLFQKDYLLMPWVILNTALQSPDLGPIHLHTFH